MVEVLIVNVLNGVRVWQSLKKCVTLYKLVDEHKSVLTV